MLLVLKLLIRSPRGVGIGRSVLYYSACLRAVLVLRGLRGKCCASPPTIPCLLLLLSLRCARLLGLILLMNDVAMPLVLSVLCLCAVVASDGDHNLLVM